MAEHGGGADSAGRTRRSKLAEYTELTRTDVQAEASPPVHAARAPSEADEVARGRREFAAVLGGFRRRRVLVPYGESGDALTVETHGARWLLAFTDEVALARYVRARGEGDRPWRYRAVWGAAVLDAGVPAVAGAGLPCGVLVNAGDGERALVLPPVVGIVPEAVALDRPESDAVSGSGTATRVGDVLDMGSGAEAG